jgi:hypothetical protein
MSLTVAAIIYRWPILIIGKESSMETLPEEKTAHANSLLLAGKSRL